MLLANEIRGMYAITPTPAKVGADRLLAKNTVDLDETERLVNALIDDGCRGLIALGTTGECPTLSQEDYEAFVSCFVETASKRVPTFIGATSLGGHDIALRLKYLEDCGADGTLLGLPMWQPMTTESAVSFYAEISQSFPNLAVMVYANQRAFRYPFAEDFWEQVITQAPTVVAAKVSKPRSLSALLDIVGGRVNIIPNEMMLEHFYLESPATTTACWATAGSMGPKPIIELMDAVQKNDNVAVKKLSAILAWANQPIVSLVSNPEEFALYTIQMEKARINAAGYCRPGPVRSPYGCMPESLRRDSEECGRRWALLNSFVASGASTQDFVVPV